MKRMVSFVVTLALGVYLGVGGLSFVTRSAAASTSKTAEPTNDPIYINGEKVNVEVYKIDGSNYFKLRDLGQALDFYVGWSQERGVYIDGTLPYEEVASTSDPASNGRLHEVVLGEYRLRFTLPESWDSGACDIEVSESWVDFYQAASRASYGGWLFSLQVDRDPNRYDDIPNSWTLTVIDGAALIFSGPTDVQFDDAYAEEYQQMESQIQDILDSIEFEKL